jgi:hypothetical protein
MSQTIDVDTTNVTKATALTTLFPTAIRSLQAVCLGASEPPDPVSGQLWADSGAGTLKQHNGTSWVVIGPIWANGSARRVPVNDQAAGLAGGEAFFVPPQPTKLVVTNLCVLSDTATAASDGTNNWTFEIYDVTNAQSLFSVLPSTNGDELAVDTPKLWAPDQNATIAADTVLEVRVTANGVPTSLAAARVLLAVEVYARAD